jgi:hypothetical protein
MFVKKNVDTLPKHWPYNYTINFMEGAQPPFKPIYNFLIKWTCSASWIHRWHLKKGFIRHSQSSIGAQSCLSRKKMVTSECVSITMGLIDSPLRIDTFCP